LRSLLWKHGENEFFQEYTSIIEQQIESSIIENVSNMSSKASGAYYLPHHPVLTPDKSTKTHIVYNGSAKAKKN